MNKATEERTIQTIAAVASLAGLSLKKATTGDDLKEFTLTLAFTGVSAGLVQERFDFERVDTRHTVNGRGEVEHVDTGDPDDWKEKAAESLAAEGAAIEKEVEAAAAGQLEAAEVETLADDAKPDVHLVGEAAALGKKRR